MSIILYIMQFSFGWQNGVDDSELPGIVQLDPIILQTAYLLIQRNSYNK